MVDWRKKGFFVTPRFCKLTPRLHGRLGLEWQFHLVPWFFTTPRIISNTFHHSFCCWGRQRQLLKWDSSLSNQWHEANGTVMPYNLAFYLQTDAKVRKVPDWGRNPLGGGKIVWKSSSFEGRLHLCFWRLRSEAFCDPKTHQIPPFWSISCMFDATRSTRFPPISSIFDYENTIHFRWKIHIYPLVIKCGNGQFPINGDFSGTII